MENASSEIHNARSIPMVSAHNAHLTTSSTRESASPISRDVRPNNVTINAWPVITDTT